MTKLRLKKIRKPILTFLNEKNGQKSNLTKILTPPNY